MEKSKKRTEYVGIRMTPEEKDMLERQATFKQMTMTELICLYIRDEDARIKNKLMSKPGGFVLTNGQFY